MLETSEKPDIQAAKHTLADWILMRLSRITSSGRFVPEIDGLRFFAIAGVIFGHIAGLVVGTAMYTALGVRNGLLFHWQSQWVDGVRLFFSISGFILAMPFAEAFLQKRPRPNLVKYYSRRVTRLEPPYIIALIIGLAGVSVYGSSFHKEIVHFFASMFYLHAIIFHQPSTISGILWSLEIEVQFYILAPLLTQVFRLRSILARRTVVVAAIACGFVLPAVLLDPKSWFVQYTIIGNLRYFLVGFLAVDLYLTSWNKRALRTFLWDGIFLAVYAAAVLLSYYHGHGGWYIYVFSLLVIMAYTASFRGRVFGAIMNNRWLVTIGGMCYTTYLYHMITIRPIWSFVSHRFLVTHSYTLDYAIQLILLCPPVLVFSSLMFAACEKPFMRRDWPKQWKAKVGDILSRRPAPSRLPLPDEKPARSKPTAKTGRR